MGETTNISWCEHTFNPWIGCTKVTPACDGCYAEAMMDLRYGRVKWGGERVRTARANWRKPVKWNKDAVAAGTRPRVFCASLADVFDNQVPPEWREDLFELIAKTPNLTWMLLTKRPQNIIKMVHSSGAIAGNGTRYLPGNAALGTTIEDQVRADLNIPHLLRAKEQCGPALAFVSCEPLLGPINLTSINHRGVVGGHSALHDRGLGKIDLVITGGETDQGPHKARVSHPDWFRSLRGQCATSGTAFHFKQWGEWRPHAGEYPRDGARAGVIYPDGRFKSHCLGDPCGEGADMFRAGSKAAGRLLDGVEHNGMPG